MLKNLIKTINKPLNILFGLLFYIILILLSFVIIFDEITKKNILIFFIYFVISLYFLDLIFLIIYKIYRGHHYRFLKKINFKKLSVEPHPYLPYVIKKNFFREQAEVYYPLNKSVIIPTLKTNSFGHFNGENGDREIILPKPKNLIRINCLGGSTTANYIKDGSNNYSYPIELENILKKKNKNIEVNNFGLGGYNSADIFVKYALQNIDTNPDYIIIYHGYNDIKSYLKENFSADYSHSLKNLGEIYWKYYLGSKIPNVPLNFVNYLTNKFILPIESRSTILDVISKKKINLNVNYIKGLSTYKRNIENIINLSLMRDTKVILSTFCFYLYPDIENVPIHKLYKKIIDKENNIMREIAAKNNLTLIDAANSIPLDNENFLDSIHFSSKGMKLLAKSIADKIIV